MKKMLENFMKNSDEKLMWYHDGHQQKLHRPMTSLKASLSESLQPNNTLFLLE